MPNKAWERLEQGSHEWGRAGVKTALYVAPRDISPRASLSCPPLLATPKFLDSTRSFAALPADSKAGYLFIGDFLLGMSCTPRLFPLILTSVAYQIDKPTSWA